MSTDDIGDIWRATRTQRREQRNLLGVPCPECVRLLPRASPSILLPQQRCRVHKNYSDPRPRCQQGRAMDAAYSGGWLPMHEAPKDAGPVLLLVPTRSTHIQTQGEWMHSYWAIFNADGEIGRASCRERVYSSV